MSSTSSHGLKVGVFQSLADRDTGDPAVVAQRAEALGFTSYWVPEHASIPEGSCDDYPGKQPGEPPPDYLFKMPDPFIALTRASATTSTIQLGTGVALVPERNPILAAKEIASLDHFSGGRVIYGIGAGWNEPECTLMGGDFDHRWTQTAEAIAVMKKLWTGEYVEHHGTYFDVPPAVCRPRPTRQPHPPIMLGSIGSPRVFRRTAQWGDGWLPFETDPQAIADGRAALDEQAKAVGRDPASLNVTLFAPDGFFRKRAELAELARAGANGAVVWLQATDESSMLEELETLAAELL